MRTLKKQSVRKITFIVVVFCFFLLLSQPSISSAGDCEDGLLRCGLEAAAIGMIDLRAGLAWAAFCAAGYLWCTMYYEM